jgi:PKD repeat protein
MRWGLVAAALLSVTVQASPTSGPAPLRVTFTASGTSTAHWDFGDGNSADGTAVEHTYAAGRWNATVTDDTGATQTVTVTAYGLTLRGPRAARYGRRTVFRGSIVPAEQGLRVTLTGPSGAVGYATTTARGSFTIRARLRIPGRYTATSKSARSGPLSVRIALPRLSLGVHNSLVAQLGGQLRRLHYPAPYGAGFDSRMLDAVYAFEKVQGLSRTGVVDARFWHALTAARTPSPRYTQPASHIEVNKGSQVLYVVRRSRVTLIVPVSTAGLPGKFTPVGRFSIYRKVVGFDPSPLGTLYDPMYFTGGYAIHGNPSVPPYPASHGCVRVPMWVAPHLYASNPDGETVYVY